jgi:pimeloyl-ACP methyl ester carboxylesterase
MGTVEHIEIPVGPFVFDALAAGPSDGELVLLLHGFPQSSYAWRRQVETLGAAGYRAVAPDQRGYSRRARPLQVEAYRTQELVADVLDMADAFGAGQFDLVGHDFGGSIAWSTASAHPERLRSLAVVSTPHLAAFRRSVFEGEQREKSAYMLFFQSPEAEEFFLADDAAALRAMYVQSGLSPERAAATEEYVRLLTEPGALTAALNWYRGMKPTEEHLRPISVPTLYVWSTEDPALGREAAEWTAEYVEGPYRFEVLEGVSHWVSDEVPDVLNRLLLEHLRSVT